MKSYKYTARDVSGQRKEGVKQAISSNNVVGWLREEGFTPISVSEVSERIKKSKQPPRRKRIKSADLAALCWQLTTMVEGGIPITTALETISEDIENLQLQDVLQQIREKIEKGQTFSDSIAEFPKVFNRLTCALVLAGETSGNMAESLHQLAEYFDNRDKLIKKVKGAMAYPLFVFGFIILIVIFIMAFIVPRFTVIFDQIGGELPAFTRGFMAFYDLLRFNLHYIIIGLILIVTTVTLTYTRTKSGHYFFSRLSLKIPLLGKVFSQAFIATFCRTMSTLLGSGVSVLEVFDILSSMTNNDVIRSAILVGRDHVIEGRSVSYALSVSGFFPNMVIKMTQVGEESGSLSRVLDRTADYYERKVDSLITIVMGMLEPIMIVTVGGIVLVVVLAMYLPIFTMSDMPA